MRIDRISSIKGSCDVEMDARKVYFALDLRSASDGISNTFGRWREEVVKHRGRFSHRKSLIIFRATACIFSVVAVSGIGSTAMTKWKEGTRECL